MAGGLKGPRVIAKIQMPLYDGKNTDDTPKFTTADSGMEVIVYWKKGIIDWLGTAVTEMDPLSYTGYKEINVISAVKKNGATGNAVDDYELKSLEPKLSKFPRGSIRQQSLKLRLADGVEFTEYENGAALSTKKSIRTLSLSYDRKYGITILEWFNFFKTVAAKSANIEKIVTPDGDSINMVT